MDLQAIYSRRAVRDYTADPIGKPGLILISSIIGRPAAAPPAVARREPETRWIGW